MNSQRKTFIQSLFNRLKSVDYLLLKYIDKEIDQMDASSDLDILLPYKQTAPIFQLIKAQTSIQKYTQHVQRNMCQIFIHFMDGSFLQIDCLFRLIRKNLVYMSNRYLLKNQRMVNGIKTYSNFCLLEHLLYFNQLNKAGIPLKYIHYFEQLSASTSDHLLKKLNQKYNLTIASFHGLMNYDSALRSKLRAYLHCLKANCIPNKQINTIQYLADTVQSFQARRGSIITFSGVDGAGKSTILSAVEQLLQTKFRKKTVVLRHRPSLLPILNSFRVGSKAEAEKQSMDQLPHSGNNQSKLGSFFRFAYYYVDYQIGQWYVFFRYQMRNYTVLYDRYYFDFIVDAKRSNIQLSPGLAKWLYRFIRKPALNFFLFAPAATILERKQELTAESIHRMTAAYQQLFTEFDSKYQQQYAPIHNLDKEKTLYQITQQLKSIL